MTEYKQNRREFLTNSAAGLAAIAFFDHVGGETILAAETEPFPELIEITITELQVQMRSGRLTSRRLVEMYLERIREVDVKTRSVLETDPNALAIADQLDKERKRGKVRSQLHGIPILIKDNIDTADKMMTTAGSLALVDAPRPKQDAFVVQPCGKPGR